MLRLYLNRAWLSIFALLASLPVLAQVDEALLAEGWSEVIFDGKAPNHFVSHASGGVTVMSNQSVSLARQPLSVDLEKTPYLAWRWRVESQVPPTDLSTKGEDDRSLALYVAFPFVPEEATLMERMKRAVVETAAGEEAPGRVLTYVWGGDGERFDRVQSPYLGASGIITILRPAHSDEGVWFDEIIDVADDYRQTFGSDAPDPISIAIGADSDDTSSEAKGVIADLSFVARASN